MSFSFLSLSPSVHSANSDFLMSQPRVADVDAYFTFYLFRQKNSLFLSKNRLFLFFFGDRRLPQSEADCPLSSPSSVAMCQILALSRAEFSVTPICSVSSPRFSERIPVLPHPPLVSSLLLLPPEGAVACSNFSYRSHPFKDGANS